MTQPRIEPRSPGAIGEHSNRYANGPVFRCNMSIFDGNLELIRDLINHFRSFYNAHCVC